MARIEKHNFGGRHCQLLGITLTERVVAIHTSLVPDRDDAEPVAGLMDLMCADVAVGSPLVTLESLWGHPGRLDRVPYWQKSSPGEETLMGLELPASLPHSGCVFNRITQQHES
jgi:hypothetical protein